MKEGHYQQEDLDQEMISGGGEEGNSMQGMENPCEDSLETPHYFQDSGDLKIQNTKNYLEINTSYDQARFDLI